MSQAVAKACPLSTSIDASFSRICNISKVCSTERASNLARLVLSSITSNLARSSSSSCTLALTHPKNQACESSLAESARVFDYVTSPKRSFSADPELFSEIIYNFQELTLIVSKKSFKCIFLDEIYTFFSPKINSIFVAF
jgi:hypothetical protein